ncbi:MAG: peptidylprolyl isomerase [Bacteroidetes bacterium]|jgi:cyclophilin family peptidyl-prolyl cis-trans isomerase|nr:peptidylprolyl isomerase [Bacteroidota bacterium]TSA59603.1 MAG: peptidylprolyl isomerase [Sediminibacterium sp.]
MSENVLTQGKIHTEKGVLTFELYDDDAPIAAANFKKLVSEGYYNGLKFHRVIPNFMVQGGCPDGTGAGGPGYSINCETSGVKQIHDRGVMSMAHRGRNTGGSQFFICHNRPGTRHLDGVHTCFGRIIDGLDVIDDIRGGDIMTKVELI